SARLQRWGDREMSAPRRREPKVLAALHLAPGVSSGQLRLPDRPCQVVVEAFAVAGREMASAGALVRVEQDPFVSLELPRFVAPGAARTLARTLALLAPGERLRLDDKPGGRALRTASLRDALRAIGRSLLELPFQSPEPQAARILALTMIAAPEEARRHRG